ncbi:hypothetical protein KI387_015572, partial [Taxus chinensis]
TGIVDKRLILVCLKVSVDSTRNCPYNARGWHGNVSETLMKDPVCFQDGPGDFGGSVHFQGDSSSVLGSD